MMPELKQPLPTLAFGSRQLVDAAGTSIAVTRSGAGPAVVCLHATGHAARDFARLAERLGHRFEFICIDWPGQGDSPRERLPTSARRYAEVLMAVVDRLDLSRCIILGNSIGGAAAIAYAAARPERVSGLILCKPSGLQPVGFIGRFVCRRMAEFFGTGEGGATDFPRKFRRYYEKEILPSEAAAWRRDEIIRTANSVAPILREAWESFARPEADIRHLAPKLRCPVLIAWAKGDRYVAWSRSKRAARSVPDHTVTLFGGGHAAFLEQPEQFDEAFLAFATRLSR